jgi:hypothetical protein
VNLNGRLARLYGAKVPADAPFRRVVLRPGERAGVLTHPYLMAAFAYPGTSSPIHRGVFLARSILGLALRPPPDAFTPLAAELYPQLTTRERVTLQTKPQACQGCHAVINPLGFTLENFDAIGRFRVKENGKRIDSRGAFQTRSGEVVRFSGIRDLARFLVKSEEVQEAFVEQMFHHLARQPVRAYGLDKLPELRRFFVDNQFSVRRLLVEIVAQSAVVDREQRVELSPATDGKPAVP